MDIGTSSLYTDYITSTASNNKASSLTDKAKTDYSNASDEELMDVCKEFESYFLEKIFDTMIDSTKLLSGKEESSYASKMVFQGYSGADNRFPGNRAGDAWNCTDIV